MELIKKIKQAETQAEEIINRTKSEVASQTEQGRINRAAAFKQAEQERKKAIDAAISKAESEGVAEVEKLQSQASKDRQELCDKSKAKTADAVAKVVNHLRD
ncbi:MAG: hypothetical protein KAS75_00880 [Planctomycetes bacterium]|nr:hypothetical protein [Planctomycetota bacterium]